MNIPIIPEKLPLALIANVAARTRAAARRMALFQILWDERFLTSAQLMIRVEGLLGRGSFGEPARKDILYRDMRAVKQAFQRTGFIIQYSRSKKRPGYYLRGQPSLRPEIKHALQGSIREVDVGQISIFRRLTPAERFRQGCSISDTARRSVRHQINRRQAE